MIRGSVLTARALRRKRAKNDTPFRPWDVGPWAMGTYEARMRSVGTIAHAPFRWLGCNMLCSQRTTTPMPILQTLLRVIQILSAIVWLGVGMLSFWLTWRAIQEIEPFFESLNQTANQLRVPSRGAPPGGASFTPADLQRLQQLLPSAQFGTGSPSP